MMYITFFLRKVFLSLLNTPRIYNRDDVFKPFYLVKTAHVEYTFKLPESSDPLKVAVGKGY